MQISDFTFAATTHELLYLIFASETGLMSVSHPNVQYEAVIQMMPRLKATILERIADSAELDFFNGDHTYLGKAVIPYKDDGLLFTQLYKGLGVYQSETKELVNFVYPLAGLAMSSNVQLRDFVIAQLRHHIGKYPAAVAHRIFNTLVKFDLAVWVPDLKSAINVER